MSAALERLRWFQGVGHVRRSPGGKLRPRTLVDAAVVRELREGQRSVRVYLIGQAAEVRNRLRSPRRSVVVHLVGRGRMHLHLAGDDHAGAAARPVGEIAAHALAEVTRLAEHRRRFREHREVGAEHDAIACGDRADAQRGEETVEGHRSRQQSVVRRTIPTTYNGFNRIGSRDCGRYSPFQSFRSIRSSRCRWISPLNSNPCCACSGAIRDRRAQQAADIPSRSCVATSWDCRRRAW